jgi:crotonobetainyl-CoA:carnitine CoA-transferase CaiB-like acyl-CoA transferase
VESHQRASAAQPEPDLFRNKRRFGLDLATEGGPELFRRVAAGCDVVAHNFTPRVMRQFGIDYPSIRAVNPDVVYLSLTGFGTTGPWGERPLFGPGAEAVSGHNEMIGPADAWPGRPGTIVYADNTCGLNAVFAILAALDHRDATGEGTHIDISLYETQISHLGPVIAERSFGAPQPRRAGNADRRYAVHGVFATLGLDRHVVISATRDQVPALAEALSVALSPDGAGAEVTLASALAGRDGGPVVAALQARGIAAAEVADMADQSSDAHLWSRGYFGLMDMGEASIPVAGPTFGGGRGLPMRRPHGLGEDSEWVLREVAGLSAAEVAAAIESGAVGSVPAPRPRPRPTPEQVALRIDRGELSRVDDVYDGWRRYAP